MDRRSGPNQTRLVLVTPPVADTYKIAPALAAAVKAADVAAVVLKLASGKDAEQIMRVHSLAPTVQNAGAALLIEEHADLVGKTGADGAHLLGIDALKAAMPLLKPEFVAGSGGLITRHDSMTAAELGADYVMFGEPDANGKRPGFDATRERVAWWAELFQIPCVGYAASLAEAGELARAGADFVALPDSIWNSSEGTGALVEVMVRLHQREPAR
jgi:thiamine-phosphate pyrophosphorylase